MRKFFKISFFVLLNMGIALYLDGYLKTHYDDWIPSDKYLRESVAALESEAKETEVLLLGDCKVFYSFDPNLIPIKAKVHNGAFPGELIGSSYWKLKYFLDRGDFPKLKTVILNLYPERLSYDYPLNTDVDYSRFIPWGEYLHLQSFWDRVNGLASRSFRFWKIQASLPYLPLAPIPERVRASGYAKMESVLGEEDFQKVFLVRSNLPDAPPRKDVLEYHRKLEKLLKDHGIQLVLMRTPEPTTLLAQMGKDENLLNKSSIQAINGIVKTHFPHLPFINLLETETKFEIQDFADLGGHFSPSGSKKLGELLKTELVHLGVLDLDGRLKKSPELVAQK